MIDKWILQDIEKQTGKANRVVILDPSEQFGYLLPVIGSTFTVLKTDARLREEWQTVQEELFLRYDADTKHRDTNVIFYVTRPRTEMSFLFDYCFTHGCIDLSKPAAWLQQKIFTHTGLQVNMENPLLLVAGKLSVGKDLNWWKRILQNLEELISIENEIIPFVNDPENYLKRLDKDVKRLFEEKLFEMLGQPYMEKPAASLAKEIVNRLFDRLIQNDVDSVWINIYHKWLDSNASSEALDRYATCYHADMPFDLWNIHPDHCFTALDKKQLEQITSNFHDKAFLDCKLPAIKRRMKSRPAERFVPKWWSAILTLLEFDTKPLSSCDTIDKVITFYTNHFYQVDRAIRNIYETFLQEEAIVRPLQAHYENLNYELMQHWIDCAYDYRSNQQAFLPQLFSQATPKTAVIVGDGIRYEMAAFVASELKKKYRVEQRVMLADMPSETEHNMSALYAGENRTMTLHGEREKYLSQKTGKAITYINGDALHEGIDADFLTVSFRDIDEIGEKMQLSALKLFGELENTLLDKIELLLNMGYNPVRLIADHGFVLTGLLDEADKIDTSGITGKKEVHERFIRTVEKQKQTEWIQFERPYNEYKYVYAAKSHRPFKSKGMYGYAHGGFTPQEMIVPDFIFSKEQDAFHSLKVEILNKKELNAVVGELFAIKIQSTGQTDDLFYIERKVQVALFKEGKRLNSSHILTIQANQMSVIEFSFEGACEVLAVLMDAVTREQLDKTVIKKSNARDFGGLLLK